MVLLEKFVEEQKAIIRKKMQKFLAEEYGNISTDVTSKLVESMPRRASAVLKAKGSPTKY